MTTPASRPDPLRIALVWEQFAPYHIDRCEAVARRLAGRAELTCVELAASSHRYAWEPAGGIAGARKLTLFPGRRAEDVGRLEKSVRLHDALRNADLVISGLSSADPVGAILALRLRRAGSRVLFCSDSKADDYPRPALGELAKTALLRSYDGGLIAGPRSHAYYRSLGVAAERLWPGYDTVSVERVRALAAQGTAPAWQDRPFLFLGRFVPKKGIDLLLDAYAAYRSAAARPRPLVLAGDGPLRGDLEAQARRIGVADHIAWPGFLDAGQAARALAGALALVLPSREEQWGLVVNEAIALGIPAIVSEQVGARDLLVGDGDSGLVVATGSVAALAEAMQRMDGAQPAWKAMARAAQDRAWFADSERFADAVEDIAFPSDSTAPALERLRTAFA